MNKTIVCKIVKRSIVVENGTSYEVARSVSRKVKCSRLANRRLANGRPKCEQNANIRDTYDTREEQNWQIAVQCWPKKAPEMRTPRTSIGNKWEEQEQLKDPEYVLPAT